MQQHKVKLSFMIPSDMEPLLDEAKQHFYDQNRSEMIRILITEGLRYVSNRPDCVTIHQTPAQSQT